MFKKISKKTIAIIGFTFLTVIGTACTVITTSCSNKKKEPYDMSIVNEIKNEMTPENLDLYTSQATNEYKRQLWKTCTDDSERAQATIEAEEFGQKIDDDVAALPANATGFDKFSVIDRDSVAEGIELMDYTFLSNHKDEYLAVQFSKINAIPGLSSEQKRDLRNQVEINFDRGTGEFRDDNIAAGAWADIFNEECAGIINTATDQGVKYLTAQVLSTIIEQGVLMQHKTVNDGLDLRTLGIGHQLTDDEMGKMFSYSDYTTALDSNSITGYKLTMDIASISKAGEKQDSLYKYEIGLNIYLCPVDRDASEFTQSLGEPIPYTFSNSFQAQTKIATDLYNQLTLKQQPRDKIAYFNDIRQEYSIGEKQPDLFTPVTKESLSKIFSFNTDSPLFKDQGMHIALRFKEWNAVNNEVDIEFKIVDEEDSDLLLKKKTDDLSLFGAVHLFSDLEANIILDDACLNLKNNLSFFTYCNDANYKIESDYYNWTATYKIAQIVIAGASIALAAAYMVLSAFDFGISTPFVIASFASAALATSAVYFAQQAQEKALLELQAVTYAREAVGPYLSNILTFIDANANGLVNMYRQLKAYRRDDSASVKKTFSSYRKFATDTEKNLKNKNYEKNLYLSLLVLFIPSSDTEITTDRQYVEHIQEFIPGIFDANTASLISDIIQNAASLTIFGVVISTWAVITTGVIHGYNFIPVIKAGIQVDVMVEPATITLLSTLTKAQVGLIWAVAVIGVIIAIVGIAFGIINYYKTVNHVKQTFKE